MHKKLMRNEVVDKRSKKAGGDRIDAKYQTSPTSPKPPRTNIPDGDTRRRVLVSYDIKGKEPLCVQKPLMKKNLEQCCSNLIKPIDKQLIPLNALKHFLSITQQRNEGDRDVSRLLEEERNKRDAGRLRSEGNKIGAIKRAETKLDLPSSKTVPKLNQIYGKEKSSSDDSKNSIKKKDKEQKLLKKPCIQILTNKNDSKVYKSVAFVEEKQELTPIKIKIPHVHSKKRDQSKSSFRTKSEITRAEKNKESERKKHSRRVDRKRKSISSPMLEVPQKEMAKWAPSCLNSHTKPYYEAWIDTTLAAVSRSTEEDQLFFKEMDVLRNCKDSMESAVAHDWNDERFAGRIRVKQS